jgi:hypothetical protein
MRNVVSVCCSSCSLSPAAPVEPPPNKTTVEEGSILQPLTLVEAACKIGASSDGRLSNLLQPLTPVEAAEFTPATDNAGYV